MSHALARQQFRWARRQWRTTNARTQEVADILIPQMREQARAAQRDRRRYERLFQPLEADLVRDAESYDSPARRRNEMGRARAEVGRSFDAARQNAQRQLESYGINPGAVRFAALDIGIRAQEAAAKAAAGTEAARSVEDTGRALRSEAINVGRGYPGAIAQTYGTSQNAGNAAVANANQTYGTGAGAMGTAPQFMGAGNNALNTWGNMLNMGYNNQLAYHNAQNASSGMGTAAGAILGFGANFLPFAEGGVVPDEVSPSGGAVEDDIPAVVTAGEFIVPEDVVRWKGEEFFQKQIMQSREKRKEVDTEPEITSQGIPRYARGGTVRSSDRRSTSGVSGTTPNVGGHMPNAYPGGSGFYKDPSRLGYTLQAVRPSVVGPGFPAANAPAVSPLAYGDPRWDFAATALRYDDPRFDFNYSGVTQGWPAVAQPARPVARPPARPAARPPARPVRPPLRPVRPVPYAPIRRHTSPGYVAIDRAMSGTGAVSVYGGSGTGGVGGSAWSGASNDASSFSGGAPGIGNYTGPNPGATDPDYGYTND